MCCRECHCKFQAQWPHLYLLMRTSPQEPRKSVKKKTSKLIPPLKLWKKENLRKQLHFDYTCLCCSFRHSLLCEQCHFPLCWDMQHAAVHLIPSGVATAKTLPLLCTGCPSLHDPVFARLRGDPVRQHHQETHSQISSLHTLENKPTFHRDPAKSQPTEPSSMTPASVFSWNLLS